MLARILHDGFRNAISAASEPARGTGSARPVSEANPEEALWQRPERWFRPFGRIFHEKCGLVSIDIVSLGTNGELSSSFYLRMFPGLASQALT